MAGQLLFERVADVGAFCGGFGVEAADRGQRAKI
jgi:hypothetical protein